MIPLLLWYGFVAAFLVAVVLKLHRALGSSLPSQRRRQAAQRLRDRKAAALEAHYRRAREQYLGRYRREQQPQDYERVVAR